MTSKSVEERVVSGEVWNEFCDSLKDLGQYILRDDTPPDAFNKAEGFRYLSRLIRGTLESNLEAGDPDFPVMRGLGNMVKLGADNPDNIYQGATINAQHEYKITGQRGTVNYLGFGLISGGYATDGTMITDDFLDHTKLDLDENGNFEIIISLKDHPGCSLKMTEGTKSVNIRQTFLDRKTEIPATLNIERLDGNAKPEPYSAAKLEKGLQSVTRYLHGTVKLFADWSNSFRPDINTLPAADQAYCQSIGGDPNIYYFHSYWELADDEVMVIHAPRIPECMHWNFQLDNYWLESLDYRYLDVTINKHSAKYNDDGSVTVYISKTDPGIGNWMDTCGHDVGTMCWRWIGTDDYPDLETKVVKFSEL